MNSYVSIQKAHNGGYLVHAGDKVYVFQDFKDVTNFINQELNSTFIPAGSNVVPSTTGFIPVKF